MSKSSRIGDNKLRKKNRPPANEPWVWLTREMMTSPAWRALTPEGRLIIDRIMIEHMNHGGTLNGDLIVTYDDFAKYIRSRHQKRNFIAQGIRDAEALGFITVSRGVRSYGLHKRPSTYTLTWLPRHDDFTSITNRWKAIKTEEQAMAKLATARATKGGKRKKDFSPVPDGGYSQPVPDGGYSQDAKSNDSPVPDGGYYSKDFYGEWATPQVVELSGAEAEAATAAALRAEAAARSPLCARCRPTPIVLRFGRRVVQTHDLRRLGREK